MCFLNKALRDSDNKTLKYNELLDLHKILDMMIPARSRVIRLERQQLAVILIKNMIV